MSKLYTSFDSAEFKSDIDRVKEVVKDSVKWAETELADNTNAKEKLKKTIEIAKELTTLYRKLGSFAQLTLSTDATNETALGMMDRLEHMMIDAQILFSKVTRFVGGIDNLQELIDTNDELKEFDYYLNETYKQASHLLPDEVEKAVAKLSLTGGNAWSRMRDMLDGTMTVEIVV